MKTSNIHFTVELDQNNIPEKIRKSDVLTGNNLGLLGSVEQLPSAEDVALFKKDLKVFENESERHLYAKVLLEANKVKEAWMVLL